MSAYNVCDCTTDREGYWVLGPICLEKEREMWRTAMMSTEDIINELRMQRDLFGRNIDNVDIPEDMLHD